MNDRDIFSAARKDMILTSINCLLFEKGMISEREYNLISVKIKTYIDALIKGA